VAKVNKPDDVVEHPAEKVSQAPSSSEAHSIKIPNSLSVRQLADLLHLSTIDTIKQLMRNGIMANINQVIDYKTAALVTSSLGYEPHLKPEPARKLASIKGKEKRHQQLQGEEAGQLQPRPPVITVMGHVDHGKTRLLDAIRQTNVMDAEVGGITQHIGAYQVEVDGQIITFIDTPGHEAFTTMRARGAQITDIAVLVVAADDGIMPQTLEAVDHARAAGVPIVVAINKIDKPNANPERVKQQLADINLVIEEWGGDTVCVLTSAKEKQGISELLENLLVVAEVENLQANPSLPTEGVVIEAKLDKTKGPLATVLIQNGTLKPGDTIVVDTTWGRVKAMFNDAGKRIRKAEPATPVEVLGLEDVPQAGDTLTAVPSESKARDLVQKRQMERQSLPPALPKAVSLGNLYNQITSGKVKELSIILKTDVQGSLEPIRNSLEQLSTEEVRVSIIHSGAGNITESDVMLAAASKGLIIGFSVNAEAGAVQLAQVQGVDINYYDVIYNVVDDMAKALKGMLAPVYTEVIEGRAEIRAVFPARKRQQAAGIYINEGKVNRSATVRVRRGEQKVAESKVISLRRFKNSVQEVTAGYEAGIVLSDFDQFEVGDILEFLRSEKSS